MHEDKLEKLLRDTLQQEVSKERHYLDGLEKEIVAELTGQLPKRGWLQTLTRLFAQMQRSRRRQLAVIGITAVIFLFLGIFVSERVPLVRGLFSVYDKQQKATIATNSDEGQLLFVMPAPGAQTVAVVGSFNNWKPILLTDEDKDGIWLTNLPLPPGRYEYAFVVDGRWWGQDPLADEYVRSFGGYNSVRYVGYTGDKI